MNRFEMLDDDFNSNNISRQKYIVDRKSLKELIDEGIATTCVRDVCHIFDRFVSHNFCWQITGYRINWDRHNGCKRFYWISRVGNALHIDFRTKK